jgi:predicted nucleic-acid-binding protein
LVLRDLQTLFKNDAKNSDIHQQLEKLKKQSLAPISQNMLEELQNCLNDGKEKQKTMHELVLLINDDLCDEKIPVLITMLKSDALNDVLRKVMKDIADMAAGSEDNTTLRKLNQLKFNQFISEKVKMNFASLAVFSS